MKKLFATLALCTAMSAGVAFAAENKPAETKVVKNLLSSEVIKANVYDPNEKKIGEVENLVLNRDGSPATAVISVGGFLGIDAKDVAIPFTQLQIKTRDGKNWLELNTTKDALKSAPAFDPRPYKL